VYKRQQQMWYCSRSCIF